MQKYGIPLSKNNREASPQHSAAIYISNTEISTVKAITCT